MKIVHLLLTRRFAGSERYAVDLANLQASEHEVRMVLHHHALENRADAIARHINAQVEIIPVSNCKPIAVWQARRVLKKLRPDVSHAHLSWGCRVLKSARQAGLRLATLHITYKPHQHQHLDGLIAIAPWQLTLIPEPLRSHSVQIDNSSLPKSASEGARQRLREAFDIGKNTLVFGTLGRLDHSKGLDVIIRAFQQAAIPHAKLVIVGDGKARKALQRTAGDDVVFPGYTREPQDWLAAFDVLVSGARSEPFGLVFLEAMHAGLPIIASASEGARHLAREIGTPLIAIDDITGFADAFIQFANRPRSRIQYNMHRFDAVARSAEVMDFYRRCLAEQHQGKETKGRL